ncbi:CDP-archaeol synthase [uncultured Thiodictyon sp.]|uniref:CDP-archaeol synthase n=1 Tax=uncultured Thiodictyon sp. TaxID=1846217 RepID=UPI0025E09361|nr:CDP-archaeol synthase [uncultured Thiodictyon sp.]
MPPHWSPLISLLALLLVANGVPAVLAVLLSARPPARPLDGGRRLRDGHPVFGPSKTWRGLIAALVATPSVAWFWGLGWSLGLAIALGAMAGDLIASFIKRRLGLRSSASVPLLDHLPETLIPALLAKSVMGLHWLDLGVAAGAFVVLDLLFTPVLKRLATLGR